MNVLDAFVLFAILLKCASASGDDVGVGFRGAVDKEDFGWLNANWKRWHKHNDLFDDVIGKGADFTVWFIQNVKDAKGRVLAALFDKGEGMIDDVLGRVEYRDGDLRDLTDYRRELAGSPEKFFRILDKMKESRNQDWALRRGVEDLFEAERHDLIVPLVNALGKRTFKSKRLKKERSGQHLGKELKEAIETSLGYITSILRLSHGTMPLE